MKSRWPTTVELSFVIPVFNGSRTIEGIVRRIHEVYCDLAIEVVLVNDGSQDDTEQTCAALARDLPDDRDVRAPRAQLRRALLPCWRDSTRRVARYVAVLDDDGQNPPEEVRRLFDAIRARGDDVVYGRYRVKQHSWFRNLGSWINDRAADVMLKKPRDLYLSSFKIMNRFLVDEITQYKGAFPYIDGLILRTTRSISQVEVEHLHPRRRSGYTLRSSSACRLNMFLNFSMIPLRLAALLGLATSVLSVFLLVAVIVDKLYIDPELLVGIPTILVTIVFFCGRPARHPRHDRRVPWDAVPRPDQASPVCRALRQARATTPSRARSLAQLGSLDARRARGLPPPILTVMNPGEHEIMARVEDHHWWYQGFATPWPAASSNRICAFRHGRASWTRGAVPERPCDFSAIC